MKKYANYPILAGPQSLRGLSLIELMISITIGLLILASMSTLFVNQSRARAELDKSNRMIDNGRYALDLLSSNIRLAGFFDQFEPTGTPAAQYNPCDTTIMTNAATNLDLLLLPVEGFNAATPISQIATPPCALVNAAGSALSLKPGSDILVVRRAGTLTTLQASAPTDGTIYLQVSGCRYEVGASYRISATPGLLTLGQRNIAGSNNCTKFGNSPAVITAPFAPLRPFVLEAYFVSPDNNPGDGIPTLKRRELTSAGFVTTPLVEGIEFMQVEYGIDNPALDTDNDGAAGLDGVPDAYNTCAACTLADWSNVVSVKLYVISRNNEPTKGYSDPNTYSLGQAGNFTPSGTGVNYKRHAYTQHVRLTNQSGRRE